MAFVMAARETDKERHNKTIYDRWLWLMVRINIMIICCCFQFPKIIEFFFFYKKFLTQICRMKIIHLLEQNTP